MAIAEYAESKGIIFPHETIVNGGSATSAAMEALEYLPNQNIWKGDHEDFVKRVLVPHIFSTVEKRLKEASEISTTQEISLYEASVVATERWLTTTWNNKYFLNPISQSG